MSEESEKTEMMKQMRSIMPLPRMDVKPMQEVSVETEMLGMGQYKTAKFRLEKVAMPAGSTFEILEVLVGGVKFDALNFEGRRSHWATIQGDAVIAPGTKVMVRAVNLSANSEWFIAGIIGIVYMAEEEWQVPKEKLQLGSSQMIGELSFDDVFPNNASEKQGG